MSRVIPHHRLPLYCVMHYVMPRAHHVVMLCCVRAGLARRPARADLGRADLGRADQHPGAQTWVLPQVSSTQLGHA